MPATARTAVLAALAVVVSPLLVVQAGAPAHAAVSVFPVPTSNAGLGRITTAPDGTMWFVEEDANKVGRITPGGQVTEYALGATTTDEASVMDLDVAPDGAVWVVYDSGWNAVRLDPATGSATKYGLGSYPYGGAVRVAGDGSAWITMNYDESGVIRIVPGQPYSWTANAPECEDVLGEATDGSMWCQGAGLDTLVRLGPDANSGTTYPLPSDASYPNGLAAGPTGSIWFTRSWSGTMFTSPSHGSIGYLDAATGATQIWSTGSRTAPSDLVMGPDRQMWFTNRGAAPGIGHISATGVGAISSVGSYEPTSLTFGPDGAIWFTDAKNNSIVRVTTDQLATTNIDLGDGVTMVAPATPAPPTPPAPAAAAVGALPKVKGVTTVRKGAIRVPVLCGRDVAGCAGRLGLETAKGGKALARPKAYTVASGKKARVKVRLSKKGLRLLRPGRVVKVRVELTAPGARKVLVRQTIKVRRG
jgi:virginiamycin B lyase